jgi:hypothetical protein
MDIAFVEALHLLPQVGSRDQARALLHYTN